MFTRELRFRQGPFSGDTRSSSSSSSAIELGRRSPFNSLQRGLPPSLGIPLALLRFPLGHRSCCHSAAGECGGSQAPRPPIIELLGDGGGGRRGVAAAGTALEGYPRLLPLITGAALLAFKRELL